MTKDEKIAKLGKEITDRATVLLGKDKITPDAPEYLGINSALKFTAVKYDEKMAAVIAKYDKACCLMHNRENTDYTDYLADVVSDLDESVNMALAAGIDRDKIMVDPGIGFAKDLHQNLLLMNNLELLHKWDLPILLGTSRKSMIGLTLDLPVTEREEGTVATSVLGLVKGCDFFRVHDVKSNYRALKMTHAMLSAR